MTSVWMLSADIAIARAKAFPLTKGNQRMSKIAMSFCAERDMGRCVSGSCRICRRSKTIRRQQCDTTGCCR